MQISHCPVCGFSLSESIDEKELYYSFGICSCCGCEYGYDDTSIYRKYWISEGAPWFNKKRQPKDWSLEKQLKNIIVDWDSRRVSNFNRSPF